MDLNILIGGEAGQGLKTIETLLGKALFRQGFNVYTTRNYMSRIRGGHNFVKIRIGTEKIHGPAEKVDILVALNEESYLRHKDELVENSAIIYDGKLDTDHQLFSVNAKEMASDINPKALNSIFTGAVLKLLNLDTDNIEEVISEFFSRENIIEDNLKLMKKGYDSINKYYYCPDLNPVKNQLFIDGNDAIGLGALAAGIKYYTAYPMSPSTGILNYIAGKQSELDVAVEQAEDEIGAINMALGASYGGVRSMTGTSGGGLSLMAESLGLAGITETPLVIADVQRPGPATGLPTRTEQGDLLFSINISQGEFPLMVISPRDPEDAFYQTFRALNLADKYQIPVILLSDQFLADSTKNVPEFDLEALELETSLISDEEKDSVKNYQRYKLTENGVSPRAYPGQLKGEVVLADSDEHDEYGHIIEDAEKRRNMVDKRMKKFQMIKQEEVKEPEYYGNEDIYYLLIGWGSTHGPLMEGLELLNREDYNVGYLSFSDLWPLPVDRLREIADNEVKAVVVENNSTAQFARLIRGETDVKIDESILKYDGRPFTGREIYNRFKEEVINNASK